MFRSLMVPLDGSTFAEHAIPFALSISRRAGAALEFVRAHEAQVLVRETAVGLELLEVQIRRHEHDYLLELGKRVAAVTHVPSATRLLDGLVVDALCKHVCDLRADLVVMTMHGRGPLSRLWLGSVADKLLRQLPVPVLLVRPSEGAVDFAQEPFFRNVLIPLDGSDLAEQIVDIALRLGTLTKAEYTLLRIVNPVTPFHNEAHSSVYRELGLGPSSLRQVHGLPENERQDAQDYLGRVAQRFRKQGCKVQTHVVNDLNHAAAILATIDTHGTDLVALATHGRGGLARFLLGSVADKVIRGAATPILVQTARGD